MLDVARAFLPEHMSARLSRKELRVILDAGVRSKEELRLGPERTRHFDLGVLVEQMIQKRRSRPLSTGEQKMFNRHRPGWSLRRDKDPRGSPPSGCARRIRRRRPVRAASS